MRILNYSDKTVLRVHVACVGINLVKLILKQIIKASDGQSRVLMWSLGSLHHRTVNPMVLLECFRTHGQPIHMCRLFFF